jgi:hypothetical protein
MIYNYQKRIGILINSKKLGNSTKNKKDMAKNLL